MNEEVMTLGMVCRETGGEGGTTGKDNVTDATQSAAAAHRGRRHFVFSALLAIAVTPAALVAQTDNTDYAELSSYAGAVFGIGAHPAVGASTGTAFARYATALIDISYMPLNSDTLLSSSLAAYRNSGLYDFSLCTDIRIPVRKRWEPYGILGMGLLYDVYQQAVLGPAGTQFASRSKTNFEFSTGGGVRYHVGDNWGIRPEVRVFITNRNFTRVSVGIFYDIETGWPFRLRRSSTSSRKGRLLR